MTSSKCYNNTQKNTTRSLVTKKDIRKFKKKDYNNYMRSNTDIDHKYKYVMNQILIENWH
jgi:hypothetical protein